MNFLSYITFIYFPSSTTYKGVSIFVKNITKCWLMFLIVSLGALINHKNLQLDSSTPSWSDLQFKFTIGSTMGNKPKNRIPLKKHFLMILVQF